MKKLKLFVVMIDLVFITTNLNAQTPPYAGTIFIDPDIITAADPSAIQSTTYIGQGLRTVFDRRVNSFVVINAYLFNVVWNDNLTSEAVINPEFGSIALARLEAEKYAFLIGQLPYCLRTEVNQIWIHQGIQLFGGGNNSLLIHTGQTFTYETDGILEETLVHEATHTSLDFNHSTSLAYSNAKNLDGNFISTYAQNNAATEDVAESFLPWLMVRHRSSRISIQNFNVITQTIPNRLLYFDNQTFNLYPFFGANLFTNTNSGVTAEVKIYPNPSRSFIKVSGISKTTKFEIYNLVGEKIKEGIYFVNSNIDICELPSNLYLLKLDNETTVKFIKN